MSILPNDERRAINEYVLDGAFKRISMLLNRKDVPINLKSHVTSMMDGLSITIEKYLDSKQFNEDASDFVKSFSFCVAVSSENYLELIVESLWTMEKSMDKDEIEGLVRSLISDILFPKIQQAVADCEKIRNTQFTERDMSDAEIGLLQFKMNRKKPGNNS